MKERLTGTFLDCLSPFGKEIFTDLNKKTKEQLKIEEAEEKIRREKAEAARKATKAPFSFLAGELLRGKMTVALADCLNFKKMKHYVAKGNNNIYEDIKNDHFCSRNIDCEYSDDSIENEKNRFNFAQVELDKKLVRSIEVLTSENHSSKYKDIQEIATFFQTLPFFTKVDLNPDDAVDLVSVLQIERFKKDTVIFEEGQLGDKFYILL